VNKHIEIVKKWLAGEDVTTEELRANSIAAAHAVTTAADNAYYWVERYEELS
tara:strand:+ start:540 stop:695 length:156 start_codon:yes stop_codon:yes gene_type:complete